MSKTNAFILIVAILVVSLFSVNNYTFTADTIEVVSEKVFEDDKLESDKDSKLLLSSSTSIMDARVYISIISHELLHYSYTDTLSLLRPPIFS
ncbi:hypothetical protein [Sulfurimonas sp.]